MALSKKQKRIITEIANHTVNKIGCERDCFIAYSTLRELCIKDSERRLQYRDNWLSEKASFSRSLHTLVKNGYVCAMALAWHLIEESTEDFIAWQGGGGTKEQSMGYEYRMDVPHYKLLGLTEQGWDAAQTLAGG